MCTHDEETALFFAGSPVKVFLSYSLFFSKHYFLISLLSLITPLLLNTNFIIPLTTQVVLSYRRGKTSGHVFVFTHHQKSVIVDAPRVEDEEQSHIEGFFFFSIINSLIVTY